MPVSVAHGLQVPVSVATAYELRGLFFFWIDICAGSDYTVHRPYVVGCYTADRFPPKPLSSCSKAIL